MRALGILSFHGPWPVRLWLESSPLVKVTAASWRHAGRLGPTRDSWQSTCHGPGTRFACSLSLRWRSSSSGQHGPRELATQNLVSPARESPSEEHPRDVRPPPNQASGLRSC